MISISRLREGLSGNRVVFDANGDVVDVDVPDDIGPTTLLVAPVIDALKRLEDDRVESLDRDEVWAVEAIALDGNVLQRLGEGEMTVEGLLEAVRDLGYSWQISPTSSP